MNISALKGYAMDDSTFLKWLLGLVATMGLLLFNWTHKRASSAHDKIDDERKDNEQRFKICYESIGASSDKITKCRNSIEKSLQNRMTEAQVKDFVDRSIKPVNDHIHAVHEDVKEILREMRK